MTSTMESTQDERVDKEVGNELSAMEETADHEAVEVVVEDGNGNESSGSETKKTFYQIFCGLLQTYDFLVGLVVVILLALAYPPLGADYLAPTITATWIAVMYIFFISGLALRTEEFKSAFKQIKIHAIIQSYNFLFISSCVYGITRFFITTGVLIQSLADGMVICACLPMAINMVIILSQSADGDEGVAVFNSAFGNMLGVFLSPLLILGYLGVSGDVDLGTIFYKLAIRVLVPIVVGQLLQKVFKPVADFSFKYRVILGKSQMYALLFIVYTVFCETFSTGTTIAASDFIIVLFMQIFLLIIFMIIAWYLLKCIYPTNPHLLVTGVFGCTFKTISLGVPLINSMYEGSPNLAMYILPLLMWYPMQLTIGSLLAPRFKEFVQRQKDQLASAGVVVEEALDEVPTTNQDQGEKSKNGEHSDGEDSPVAVVDLESPQDVDKKELSEK